MGAPRTTKYVLDILGRHRGTDVTMTQIQRELKEAGHPLDHAQVVSAIGRLIARNGLPITVVVQGAAWRYEASNAAPATASKVVEKTYELFELVGRTSDGTRIVRDESLTLYKLSEM